MTGAEIELPELARRPWLGVIVSREMVAGIEFWAVTVNEGMNRAVRRRWFPDRSLAICAGAELADAHGLPLFDNTFEAEAA